MTYPLISVVMCAYNSARFLREALEGVLNQDLGDFEFIIVDDASTDTTWKILEEYAERDRRIRVFRQDRNLGLTASLGNALSKAEGQFIARMDADDRCLPGRFRAQVNLFDGDSKLGILGTWVRNIFENGSPFEEICYPNDDRWIRSRLESGFNCYTHGSIMFRRSLLARITPPVWRFKCGQDYDFYLRLLDLTRFGFVPEVLYEFRIHSEALSAQLGWSIRHELRQIMLDLLKRRRQNESEFDWQQREQAALVTMVQANALQKQAWVAYREGVCKLLEGKTRDARERLKRAQKHSDFGLRKQVWKLKCLSYLPSAIAGRAARLLRRRIPETRFIKPLPH